jgi:hypothetical protein
MPIEYKTKVAVFTGQVGVEEAEELLAWLQTTPASSINLKQCVHVHGAVLQTLMFTEPKITKTPEDPALLEWLQAARVLPEGE